MPALTFCFAASAFSFLLGILFECWLLCAWWENSIYDKMLSAISIVFILPASSIIVSRDWIYAFFPKYSIHLQFLIWWRHQYASDKCGKMIVSQNNACSSNTKAGGTWSHNNMTHYQTNITLKTSPKSNFRQDLVETRFETRTIVGDVRKAGTSCTGWEAGEVFWEEGEDPKSRLTAGMQNKKQSISVIPPCHKLSLHFKQTTASTQTGCLARRKRLKPKAVSKRWE
jgi:hypothetical protein